MQSGDAMMYLVIARDFILNGDWRQTDVYHYLYPSHDGRLIWHHEYLSMLIFYGAWAIGGFAALIVLKSALLGLMFFTVLRASPEDRNAHAEWIAIWILAILSSSFRFIERSSLFSDLFTVVLVTWLLRERSLNRNFLLRLVLLFTIWTQLHPGFVAGLALLLLWCAWHALRTPDFLKKELALLLLIPLAMLANPSFLDGLLYPFQFALNEARVLRLYNFEWLPAYHAAFRFTPEMLAFWILSLFSAYFFVRAKAWRNIEALFAVAAFLSVFQAVRFVPAASMIIALTVKPHARFLSFNTSQLWLRIALVVFLCVVSIRNLGWGYESSSGKRLPELGLDPKFFPSKTLENLRSFGPQSFYNSHDFGAYLLWLGIKPVFHHGFVTDMKFYQREVIGSLQTQSQFLELARKYGWKVLLVDRFGGYRQAHRILSPIKEWKIVSDDEAAYLIVYLP